MLDPTLSAYALAVAAASGVVAAGMHATTVLGSPKAPPPRRVFIAELIRTFVVGAATSELIRHLPGQWQLVPVLLVAAVVGSTLGPRGLLWLLLAGLSVLKRLMPMLDKIPDPPTPDDPAKEAPKDA